MTHVYVLVSWRAGQPWPIAGPFDDPEQGRDLLGLAIADSYAGRLDPGAVGRLGVARVTREWLVNHPAYRPTLEVAAA